MKKRVGNSEARREKGSEKGSETLMQKRESLRERNGGLVGVK